MLNFFEGKLTYTVAALTGLWAVVGFFLNLIDAPTAGNLILASLATFGIRRALP